MVLLPFAFVLVDLDADVAHLLLAGHSPPVHLVQGLFHFDPIPIVLLLEGLNVILAQFSDVAQHGLSAALQALMILPDGILARAPDLVELGLDDIPVTLQLVIEHSVNKVDGAFQLAFTGLRTLQGEVVDLLGGILQLGVVPVQLVVEGADHLLLLLDFLVDAAELALHHGPQDLRDFLPAVVLLLLLLRVRLQGARAPVAHALLLLVRLLNNIGWVQGQYNKCRNKNLHMSSNSSKIFQSIKNSQNEKAKSLSEGVIDDIEDLVDGENSTLLHVAANSNNLDMAEFYLKSYNHLIKSKPATYNEETKLMWLKARDNEGFSCLHYAVFRGNFKMVTLLEQNGADIYQINNQGLTVLHIAAQGDSPLLMYYFLNKGLKIGVVDAKGSTPLHWACYSGMENAAYALISWGAEIDKQEFTFGMTPLHLAVMSGNGRIVKKLLLKGCDRNIRAYNGKLPLDIAKQNEYKNISDMIIDKQGIEELMNIKTPFRKLHKHTLPFYLLLFLFLSNYVLNVSFVIHSSIQYRLDLSIAFLVIGFIVGLFFLISKLSNPGILKPQNNTGNMFQMLVKNKPTDICFDCKIVKPERSRHCEICESCICVYDHHCPWIANCVGANNYLLFYCFLVSMLVFMAFTIPFEIINLANTEWKNINALDTIRTICEIYSLATSVLFILPLMYFLVHCRFLIVVQTKNMLQNKTTFQRYGYQKAVSNATTMQPRPSDHSRSNKYTNASQQLKMKLVEHSESSHSLHKPMEIESQFIMPKQDGQGHNCYQMCFGNRRNIKYQIAL